MNILKKGKGSPHDRSAVFDCDGCGATIKAKKSEGKYVSDWRDGDFVEVRCPKCKAKNNVSADLFQLP